MYAAIFWITVKGRLKVPFTEIVPFYEIVLPDAKNKIFLSLKCSLTALKPFSISIFETQNVGYLVA